MSSGTGKEEPDALTDDEKMVVDLIAAGSTQQDAWLQIMQKEGAPMAPKYAREQASRMMRRTAAKDYLLRRRMEVQKEAFRAKDILVNSLPYAMEKALAKGDIRSVKELSKILFILTGDNRKKVEIGGSVELEVNKSKLDEALRKIGGSGSGKPSDRK